MSNDKKKHDQSESKSEEIVRKSCAYCNGHGFIRTLGANASIRECPACGGGDFHKMVNQQFDLKK